MKRKTIATDEAADIREPAVAGMFYPSGKSELEQQIDQMLKSVPPLHAPPGDIVALISPHAGYPYSGPTAAHAYKLIAAKSFDTIVIVSPSHREYFEGISVYSGRGYRTPLGVLEVDRQLREQLASPDAAIEVSLRGHREEHAIEVQLPFLQRSLEGGKILPIVMGDQKRELCMVLGNQLGTLLSGLNVLLIASTDLSHYYFYEDAERLDRIAIDDVARFDAEGLMADLEEERTEACGGGPMVAVLIAARMLGANQIRVLHHCNSGDVTGDRSSVVGYLSAAAFRSN